MPRNKEQLKSKIESNTKLPVQNVGNKHRNEVRTQKSNRGPDKERTKTCLEIDCILMARLGKYPFDTSRNPKTFRNLNNKICYLYNTDLSRSGLITSLS